MQLNNKFLFERDFDVEKVNQQRVSDEQQKVELLPPSPMFDEETLQMAQAQAYQQGLTDGLKQAEQNQQQMLMGLWDRAGLKLAALLEQDDMREKQAQTLAIRSAFYVIKKFWPKLQSQTMQQDLEHFIGEHLAQNTDESRIVLRVNDAQLDLIANQVPRLKELQGFPGKVITLADDSVALGDCKMEWADGGAEKLGRLIMNQLDQLMERLVGQMGNQTKQLQSGEHTPKQESEE